MSLLYEVFSQKSSITEEIPEFTLMEIIDF